MKITTCYTVAVKHQLVTSKFENQLAVECRRPVDASLMKHTSQVCLSALKLCADVFLCEWEYLSGFPVTPKEGVMSRKRAADVLIHSTRHNKAPYKAFDELFPYFPSYMRRAVIAKALGIVSSYISNHRNWEEADVNTRGSEPTLGMPDRYELAFYEQDRDVCDIDKGIIGLKLYDGRIWGWHYFQVSPSDARYISKLKARKKMLSPVVQKNRGRYEIRFSFEEIRALVSDEDPLSYTILAVDLGVNAPASWCVMTADGTVHRKGVIHLPCDEDRLRRVMNRKRMYQRAGKKSKCIYRYLTAANRQLSVDTCRELMRIADKYNADCIVFEHLDKSGRIKGGSMRERIHMWRALDVQKRVETQAHMRGMRISRVCAWGTSALAFNGSGPVKRGHAAGLKSYSLCRFQDGKIYNCDISAAQNIGARFFLREYAKRPGCPELPSVPQRTYATLRSLIEEMPA